MKHTDKKYSKKRRDFLKGLGLTVGGTVVGLPLLSFGPGRPVPAPAGKLGVALVGLGQYSINQLGPALQETKNCYLAGVVTGTPEKGEAWKKQYNLPDKNIYNYENFDQIKDNQDIDIVYVVLPNSMHAEFTIRAANAGKHVICEKPMATSVEDAERMIEACRKNNVQLAIGYRLHFEPYHKRAMELGQQEIFGKVKHIEANFSHNMTNGNPDVWRLREEYSGGGAIMDLGIYCIQAACYTMGKNPIAVTARFGENTKPTYFYSVHQSVSWKLEFEGGLVCESNSSYGENQTMLKVEAEKGWWRLSPAYGYHDKKGKTSKGEMNYPDEYEQVHQMDAQAESFRNNEKSITPGEMGLRDVKILMAILESAEKGGKRIELKNL